MSAPTAVLAEDEPLLRGELKEMLAAQWPTFARDLPKKVVSGGLAISGVYDLRDIVNVPSVNGDVGCRMARRGPVPSSRASTTSATTSLTGA